MHRGIAASTAVCVALLALVACSSGPRTYASPTDLKTAYVNAGGKCAKPASVPESMVEDGAHTLLCGPGVNLLIVFDSETQKNRYLAETLNDDDLEAVVGTRWVVMTKDGGKYAGPLGGKVEKG